MTAALDLAPDLAALRARIQRLEGAGAPGDVTGFGVPEPLRSAFPTGLRAGATYAVTGSLTLALVLLAEACSQGAWSAVVGLPGLGLEVAARMGLDLERTLLVPAPGEQWATVVAALAEIVPVVLARPVRLAPTEASRLTARLRERGCTLLLTEPPAATWSGVQATLHASPAGWRGLGAGHGCLLERRLAVEVQQRTGRRTRHHLDVS
ncbi:hypothetical protein GCM10011584_08320 [Nocardioides phosphati]|uniref:Recombinase A n=1 Tax=Nocardioides phosphati TaxID=1867775 RepID=A0ABQ2N808_9ACTN|nr:hypothetical protein [Nocardioides phosphati]GGO86312.1 hypothetical protein GCM10011584_08320 [Nocardioides phosphati]